MKRFISIVLILLIIIGISIDNYYVNAQEKSYIKNQQDQVSYTIDLNKFAIKSDGTNPVETSKGINNALQFAKQQGFKKVVFPQGIYLIDEKNPIILDMKDMIIDLNGATLQINTNGLDKYSIVTFKDSAYNLRLTNGVIRGDKDTHDYKTLNSTHEWACGVTFEGGSNLEMDHITVSNVPGYGVNTKSGNDKNRFHTINNKDLEFGSISENGVLLEQNQRIRTKMFYDISNVGEEFELGYTLGYQGYPYLKNKEFKAYFYDNNKNFIQVKDGLQFKKLSIPKNSVYVKFVFPQNFISSENTQAAWISNFKPPTNVNLNNCIIKENRTLGLAFCGGQKWIIENNLFESNGGNNPGYAIDFEDGWELMQDVIVKNNKFKNNAGDIVSCAGDNFLFQGNDFTSVVYMWSRTTNYKFLNNKFNSTVIYEYNTNVVSSGNNYKNGVVYTERKGDSGNILFTNEVFHNNGIIMKSKGEELINSTISAEKGKNTTLDGVFKNCIIKAQAGNLMSSKMYNCTIEDSVLTSQGKTYFEECFLKKSEIRTTSSSESINFNKSRFTDGTIKLNTWGNAVEVIIENSNIFMENGSRSVIEISAAKMKNLIFKNNTVINSIKKPIFDMFDTTYRTPEGNVFIENNKINQTNHLYIFDGKDINSGVFNFTERNNTVNGAQILNPKYINNQYFKITN